MASGVQKFETENTAPDLNVRAHAPAEAVIQGRVHVPFGHAPRGLRHVGRKSFMVVDEGKHAIRRR